MAIFYRMFNRKHASRATSAAQQIKDLRQSLAHDETVRSDPNARHEALVEARELLLSLEDTDAVVERVCFQAMETVAIDLAIKMGIFEEMREGIPCSSRELAAICKPKDVGDNGKLGVDRVLMERIMRALASFGAVDQKGLDSYQLNTVSRTFAMPLWQSAVEFCLHFCTPAWLKMTDYFQEHSWQNPTKPNDTAFHIAFNQPVGMSVWEILAQTPYVPAGMAYISAFNAGHKDWLDFYPVQERLIDGIGMVPPTDFTMFVDVGGGNGIQAKAFKKRFPKVPGRYIVQDLASVLSLQDRKDDDGVEFMEHDFRTEQPIKGARLYYFRYVPHDWNQEFVIDMMRQIRKVMKPGFSRLIVHEWIVPEQNATKFMAAQDLNMICIGSGMERTEALHRDYMEKAGLTVTGVYSAGDAISEGIIEAMVDG